MCIIAVLVAWGYSTEAEPPGIGQVGSIMEANIASYRYTDLVT